MRSPLLVLLLVLAACAPSVAQNAARPVTTTLTIRQAWDQEPTGYDRKSIAYAPNSPTGKTPVLIFFHGAGGSAQRSIGGWIKRFPSHLIVAPQGYKKTWNVHGEPSRAPDIELVRALIKRIGKEYRQADLERVIVAGYSNGAGLIHRLMIEVDEPLFQKAVIQAASLIEEEYHQGSFWMPSKSTEHYDRRKAPKIRPEVLYIHGTNDKVVPYRGGLRFGKFGHISAPETAFRWAHAHGYRGEMIPDENGEKIAPGVIRYRYAGTGITFLKVIDGNHGLQPHRKTVDSHVRMFINSPPREIPPAQ